MAMKSPETEPHRPLRDLLRRLIKAPTALAIVWPALLVVAGYVAWHQWGAEHVANRFHGIDPALIEVSEAPSFVRTDVVEAVYRDTAMESLSLLDRKATAKIASAFSLHPWVRRVVSVRKLPGGVIDVRLQYRHPVAMVLVPDPNSSRSGYGFFPVDEDGIMLPSDEFAGSETMQYIHIVVPGVYATGKYGSPFGDSRVDSAAKLAAVLAQHRVAADIVSIDVPGDPRLSEAPQLELTTGSGKKRFWGSPPGMELPGEPTAAMKLQSLLHADAAQNADLRMAARQIP